MLTGPHPSVELDDPRHGGPGGLHSDSRTIHRLAMAAHARRLAEGLASGPSEDHRSRPGVVGRVSRVAELPEPLMPRLSHHNIEGLRERHSVYVTVSVKAPIPPVETFEVPATGQIV